MGSFFVDNAPPLTSTSDPRFRTIGQGMTAAGQTMNGSNPRAADQFVQQYGPQALPHAPQIAQGAQQAGAAMGSGVPVSPLPMPSQPGPGGGQGDPQQIAYDYAKSLGPANDENIAKTAAYMQSLGYDVRPNPGSDGFWLNGQGWDIVKNYKSGNPEWQQPLIDGVNGGGNPNDPQGFQTGTFTGGGQYPLASVMGTGLAQPWTTPFKAPDNLTEQNDPGFQARMKMGTDAIQRSAASRGTLLTGGLLKGLDRYAQDYASNEYSNVYGRALGEYQQAYGIFNNNQSNLFNRLGQLGSVGENAAAGVGNAQIGAGDARAQGSIAQGNIWGNTINNGVNAGLQYMNQRYQNQNPATTAAGVGPYNPNGNSGVYD